MQYDLCIIGGAGHIGLPLGVVFADNGVKTVLLDINEKSLADIQAGKFPFKENGGPEALKSALAKKTLFTSVSPAVIGESRVVLIVLGTPVDEYLSPQFGGITRIIDKNINHFRDGQVIVLRSTVYPGTTEKLQHYFEDKGKKVKLAFAPERITQGYAIEELKKLPQMISAFDSQTEKEVMELFKKITPAEIIPMKPMEAELAKLFTNAWRYIRFAVANQFFIIANDHDLDYHKIHEAMTKDYDRNKDLPRPGFAAGPCLFKDTMQLAAFNNNNFGLGHAAMLVNEGLVNHLMTSLRREYGSDLKNKTIGILGMAFKAESDDSRDSLSYKLRKLAQVECKQVLCTDEYVKDASFHPLDNVLQDSDIVFVAAPHKKYAKIDTAKYPDKKFVDIWRHLRMA